MYVAFSGACEGLKNDLRRSVIPNVISDSDGRLGSVDDDVEIDALHKWVLSQLQSSWKHQNKKERTYYDQNGVSGAAGEIQLSIDTFLHLIVVLWADGIYYVRVIDP